MLHFSTFGLAALLLAAATPQNTRGADAISELQGWLKSAPAQRAEISSQPWSTASLTKAEAATAADLLWTDFRSRQEPSLRADLDAKVLHIPGPGPTEMKFETVEFGDPKNPPKNGRSLFISMHGGGGAPPAVNESQWRNQIALAKGYAPAEGIYVAPRAPTDTWNLWHESHIDAFFDRLIRMMVLLKGVDANRVYLMGYSAGGDGVYQLAPRMSDRWAAAAMSAGHPNETKPVGLRNVPFALQVGEMDAAYDRNKIATQWKGFLAELHAADPKGYQHFVELPAGKPHWMGLLDKKAIPWMEKFTRTPLPQKIAWRQDDIIYSRNYWLSVDPGGVKAGDEIFAEHEGQNFRISSNHYTTATVWLNDEMADIESPVTFTTGSLQEKPITSKLNRTVASLWKSLEQRGDRFLMFSVQKTINLKQNLLESIGEK